MKLNRIVEQLITEAEEKQQIAALDQAMGNAFKAMGSLLSQEEDKLKQDVQQANIKITEAVTVVAVIGMILAAPKVVELLVKSFQGFINLFKKIFPRKGAKTEEEQETTAGKIVEFCHKWHRAYVKGLKWILKVTGMFKKAGIESDSEQQRAAEMIYYVLIAALAAYSGISAGVAFKNAIATKSAGELSLGALESAMAVIKSGEVASFVGKLGLKA